MSSPTPASPSKAKKGAVLRKSGKKGDEKRQAEERRRQEDAAAEARERERMASAENDSRLWALDLARRALNAERRQKETHDVTALENLRTAKLGEFNARKEKDAEWRAYLAAAEGTALVTPRGATVRTRRPRVVPIDPTSEAEVNTWLSLWAERDVDLRETLQDAQIAEYIIRDMDRIFATAERTGDRALIARLYRDIAALRDMATAKIDRATAHVIQHADDHANAKNEVLLAHDTGDIKFCLWINLSKNPRVKTIEFMDLAISIDIPKTLALSSVAVRLIHYRYDNMSIGHSGEYFSSGGVMHLDLLTLPPPPKKVKGWTLRQVTPLATNIVRLPYNTHPSHGSTSDPTPGSSTPIRVAWPIARDVVVAQGSSPQVGWWDADANSWRIDSLTDVNYDADARVLALNTYSPVPLALLQKTTHTYPLAAWELKPLSGSTAVLTLVTRSGVEVQIKIGEGYCSLLLPDNDELQPLCAAQLEPGLLLRKLALSGLALTNQTGLPPGSITPKDEALERDTFRQIARAVRSFSFRNSHANQLAGAKTCLFLVNPSTSVGSLLDQEEGDKGAWKTSRIMPLGCQLLEHEPTAESLTEPIEIEALCSHLVQCLAPLKPELSHQSWATSAALSESTETLLFQLRLFSFTN